MVFGLVLAVAAPRLALAQADPPAFPDTGYTIANDTIWSFFSHYGGMSAFGAPISRKCILFGRPVQLFHNAALQVQPDGSVQPMSRTSQDFLPYSRLAGLTVPAADAATALVAPSPDFSETRAETATCTPVRSD